MIFTSKVCGIPCQIQVTYFQPYSPGQFTAAPEDCYYNEPAAVEFEVLDRRGRSAPWLQKKLTAAETERIEQEVEAQYNSSNL